MDLEEVGDVANNEPTIYQTIPNTQSTAQEPLNEPTETPQRPPAVNNNQAIELWQETFLAPLQKTNSELLKSNERQAATIGDLREELGMLKERLRALEAAQAARDAQPAPQPPAPIQIYPYT